jgi:flagellar biosynthetic protein FliO
MLSLLCTISTEPATTPASVDFTWLFIKMLLLLIVICVLAVILLKFVAPRLGLFKPFQKGRYFNVLGRYQLEPKKALYLVKVAKRYLVLGTADHGINFITEISEEEALGKN